MSSKSENAEIAVLQSQMDEVLGNQKEMSGDLKAVSQKLDNFAQSFVPRKEYDEFKKGNWARHTLSAVAGAVLTTLVAVALYATFHIK